MDIPKSPELPKPIAPQETGPVSPEAGKEGLPSREAPPAPAGAEKLKESLPPAPPVAAPSVPAISAKDPYTTRIERVLEDNLIDACIDHRRTMITRREPEPDGDRLFFFARGGAVTFDEIVVRPLSGTCVIHLLVPLLSIFQADNFSFISSAAFVRASSIFAGFFPPA